MYFSDWFELLSLYGQHRFSYFDACCFKQAMNVAYCLLYIVCCLLPFGHGENEAPKKNGKPAARQRTKATPRPPSKRTRAPSNITLHWGVFPLLARTPARRRTEAERETHPGRQAPRGGQTAPEPGRHPRHSPKHRDHRQHTHRRPSADAAQLGPGPAPTRPRMNSVWGRLLLGSFLFYFFRPPRPKK